MVGFGNVMWVLFSVNSKMGGEDFISPVWKDSMRKETRVMIEKFRQQTSTGFKINYIVLHNSFDPKSEGLYETFLSNYT